MVRQAFGSPAGLLWTALLAAGCRAAEPEPERSRPPGPKAVAITESRPRAVDGQSIVVAGRRVPIGTRVVLWTEPPFYDAYRETPRFELPTGAAAAPDGPRFRRGREGLGLEPAPEALAGAVDQLVLHYDACGSSERCFRVLHDLRGLSVHFLLDVDGTIYQTLDAREQAWHATKANRRSVGVEIANVGAYPPDAAGALWRHYQVEPGAARAPDGVSFVEGVVQGQRLVQAELTPAQLVALVKLAAGLARALPGIRPDAPRDALGRVRDGVLEEGEYDAFRGVLGHYHVQANKLDPGPAFPWEAFLAGLQRELASP